MWHNHHSTKALATAHNIEGVTALANLPARSVVSDSTADRLHAKGRLLERQRGFIITTTMVLVFTVVFIGLFVGFSLVINAWVKREVVQDSVDVYVVDANDQVLGKAVSFDEHETPLVPFVDYDVTGSSGNLANYRVLIGVRDDRFTSRERVYYPDSTNCTGQACLFVPSTETSGDTSINSEGIDQISGTGGVSYQLATQAGGGAGTQYNYAIGSSSGGLPGQLYRQTAQACTVTINDNTDTYLSFWQSQRVSASTPCYTELIATPADTTQTTLRCGGNIGSNTCCVQGQTVQGPSGNLLCSDSCVDDSGNCACPSGYFAPGNNASGWCCPDGSDPSSSNGDCQQIAQTFFQPTAGTFIQAESVGGNPNILDSLAPPFTVTQPIHPDGFQANPAQGVE